MYGDKVLSERDMLEVGDIVVTSSMMGVRNYPITRVTKTLAKSRRDANYEHTFKRAISSNMQHPGERWNTTRYSVILRKQDA